MWDGWVRQRLQAETSGVPAGRPAGVGKRSSSHAERKGSGDGILCTMTYALSVVIAGVSCHGGVTWRKGLGF